MIPTSKSASKHRKRNPPPPTEQASPRLVPRTGPVALVSRFDVRRCHECGEPVKEGDRVWWVRPDSLGTGGGTAHLTCGWTLKNGSVHPATISSIRDIAPAAQQVPASGEANPTQIEEESEHVFSSEKQMGSVSTSFRPSSRPEQSLPEPAPELFLI